MFTNLISQNLPDYIKIPWHWYNNYFNIASVTSIVYKEEKWTGNTIKEALFIYVISYICQESVYLYPIYLYLHTIIFIYLYPIYLLLIKL